METAFQADAFQSDALAFQIVVDVPVVVPASEPQNGVAGGLKKRRKRKHEPHYIVDLREGESGFLLPMEEDAPPSPTDARQAPVDDGTARALRAELALEKRLAVQMADHAAAREALRLRLAEEDDEDDDFLLLTSA